MFRRRLFTVVAWGVVFAGVVALLASMMRAIAADEVAFSASADERRTRQRHDRPLTPLEQTRAPWPQVTLDAGLRGSVAQGVDAGLSVASAEPTPDGGLDVEALRLWLDQNAQQAARNVDAFCERNRKLRAIPALAPPKTDTARAHDAELFMSARIDWEGGRLGSLHLPAPLTQHMANQGWLQFTGADLAGLDFDWLRALLEFDTWSVGSTGPLHDSTANFFEAPIPNFMVLQHWAKLRLVKGRADHDLPQASREVRHLAELCGSTGLLIGDMIRLAIYGIERTYYDSLGLPAEAGLPSPSDALTYRKMAFAAMKFLYPGVAPDVRKKALACMVARCAATTEALGASLSLRGVSFDADATTQWLLEQEPCDRRLTDLVLRMPPASPTPLTDLNSLEEYVNYDVDAGG